ncbi:MAG: metallophosphoesterase [Actinobacteria bacterium]|nr:metallophosphoesterase [Actinomycetota bacterium]
MSAARPLRICHLGSIHCGDTAYDPGLLRSTVTGIRDVGPDLVVVAGDLTAGGYDWEYDEAATALERLDAPTVVVPGNHDSRNVGYVHFERRFGDRFTRRRIELDGERAERLGTGGITVLGADSSEPDLEGGRIGREWYDWVREGFTHPDDFNVFVLHHHLVAIPGAGREANVIQDAGDVLAVLTELGDVDLVLSGHKHVPFFWGLNGTLVANCGTASTRRVRGTIPPSWNELVVDASSIKVFVHYTDGRRQLAVIRSRITQRIVQEAFFVTDRFFASNHLPVD